MRRRWRVIGAGLLSALLLPAAGAAAADNTNDQAELVMRVIQQHVLPGYKALDEAAAKLPIAVAQVCTASASNDGGTAALRSAFQDTAEKFAAIDFFRFGPMASDGRRERLAFWPDPRGVMARQMRTVIEGADPAMATQQGISHQSAAVQGLPALEALITDAQATLGPQQPYRCALAQAIADNIASISRQVLDAWTDETGIRASMSNPDADNATYKTHAESAAEFVKALLTGLQVVSELQLKPRLQPKGKHKNLKAGSNGPYAKLGLERAVYASSIASLNKLYALLDLESYLKPEKAWIKGWASGAWRAMAMSDGMGGPAPAVASGDAPRLDEVVSRIGGLRMLIGKEMSNAAGIAIGFNELDGD